MSRLLVPGRSIDDLRSPTATQQIDRSARFRQTDHSIRDLRPIAPAMPVVGPSVLVGERQHRLYVLPTEKIEFIEAHGNYVKLHAGNAEYISRDSVKRLTTWLHGGFLRIERSLLINVRAILYVQRLGRGTYGFTLTSGQRLCSGATYRGAILQALPLAQAPRPPAAQHDEGRGETQ